ncbi:MAG: SH3 domain-containing protein [Deltaproteobacteria bacterium]
MMTRRIFSVMFLCVFFYACAGSQTASDNVQATAPAKNVSSEAAAGNQEQKNMQQQESARASQPAAPVVHYLYITRDTKMRKDPKNFGKVIVVLKKGELVEKISDSKNWVQVKSAAGKTGWVLKKFVFESK